MGNGQWRVPPCPPPSSSPADSPRCPLPTGAWSQVPGAAPCCCFASAHSLLCEKVCKAVEILLLILLPLAWGLAVERAFEHLRRRRTGDQGRQGSTRQDDWVI